MLYTIYYKLYILLYCTKLNYTDSEISFVYSMIMNTLRGYQIDWLKESKVNWRMLYEMATQTIHTLAVSLPPDAIWNSQTDNCGSKCCRGVHRYRKYQCFDKLAVDVVWSTLQILTTLPPGFSLICSNLYCAIWHLQGAMRSRWGFGTFFTQVQNKYIIINMNS